jgi:nucleoside-diphosphate-sugar epimerase
MPSWSARPTILHVPRERVLVTGSAGHLGEALVRVLRGQGRDVVGLDLLASPFTTVTGPVTDRAVVRRCLAGVGTVLHAATLHKPHIGSHARQDFVDTNVSGTLTLLEEAVAAGVESFVFTSSTSVFGRALTPRPGEPATWITEDVTPVPRNIYGVTKAAAEDLCEIIARDHGLPVVVLRVSRFFPEDEASIPAMAEAVRHAAWQISARLGAPRDLPEWRIHDDHRLSRARPDGHADGRARPVGRP